MPNVSPKPLKQCQAEFSTEITRLAELAFSRYCQNIYSPLYLVGTKRAGLDTLNPYSAIWDSFTLATAEEHDERKPALQIVRPEPLPRNATLPMLTDTIRQWLKNEPNYIFAD